MENTAPVSSKKGIKSLPKWAIYTIAGIFLLIYAVAAVVGFRYFTEKHRENSASTSNSKSATSISGTINLNGAPPEGSTISVGVKSTTSSSYKTVLSNLAPNDGAVWSWNDAQDGEVYEIQAYLQQGGNTIATSETLEVAAPADNEVLHLNVKGGNSNSNVATVISGTFNLNGYIPNNATITLMGRAQGASSFTNLGTGLSARDNSVWTWAQAKQNTTYQIQASLVVNGNTVSQSQVLTVTAPATGEVLTINSSLTPPAPATVSLSGSINLNGSIPNNSSISIGVRQTGTSSFNMVTTNLAAVDNINWSWSQAQSGTSYDMQAYLINNGNTIASSQILTAAAPASGEVLTINAQNQPPAPPGASLTNQCVSKNSNNQWQVQFTYNSNSVIQNAKQFQLTAGTSSGNNSIVNITNSPSNPTQSQNYTSGFVFTEGQTYYAQWSYATCTNCGTFSPNSPSLQFYCNTPAPTNTPTNTPTSTPTTPPTNTPTTTLAPITTNTPTPTNPAPTN